MSKGLPIQDRVIFIEGVPSSNPPSGHRFLYIDPSDGLLKTLDSAGSVNKYYSESNLNPLQEGSGDTPILDKEGNAFYHEVGTFTPYYTTTGTGFDSVSYQSPTGGKYIKINNYVCCTGAIRTSSINIGSASGDVLIGGFPFTSTTVAGERGNGYINNSIDFSGNYASVIYVMGGSSEHLLKYYSSSSGHNDITVSDLNPTGENYLFFKLDFFI